MRQDDRSKLDGVSRRQFLQGAGGAAAGSVLVSLPHLAHAQEADSANGATRAGLKRFAASGGEITLEVNGRAVQRP